MLYPRWSYYFSVYLSALLLGQAFVFIFVVRFTYITTTINAIPLLHPGTVGLTTLREAVAIIPQHPNLFVGTVRRNLDPFLAFDDADLWSVLKDGGLEQSIQERKGQLNSDVAEGGANFSQGEKQLICVARALLRKPKILLLDEATASIDGATDAMIQKMVRHVFKGTTQITIAHRLNTIADSDQIVVLDNGVVVEMDSPANLLRDSASHYSAMVRAAASAAVE
jgi:ABC-type multidrug transport system fused ATPase/permease subunit